MLAGKLPRQRWKGKRCWVKSLHVINHFISMLRAGWTAENRRLLVRLEVKIVQTGAILGQRSSSVE